MNEMIISDALRDSDFFSPLDFQFAGFIAKLECVDDPFLRSISALLSRSARRRDVCLNLESLPDDFPEELSVEDRIVYSSPDEIAERLRTFAIVGAPGDQKPVILDGTRLYLLKFFRYETLIASEVAARAADIAGYEGDDLRTMLDELFPAENEEVDWQRCAAINASTRRLSVITGGPGSGKTTTVVKVLLILMNDHQRRTGSYPDIALAAPTGKAAAHMQQSVASAVDRIIRDDDLSRDVRSLAEKASNAIPASGLTLHRLFSTARMKGDRKILPYDIIVIDECSMADIALFSRFIEMTDRATRVLILGDKDQLSSVEAGSVLGDLCAFEGTRPVYPPSFALDAAKYSAFKIPDESISDKGTALSGAVTYLTKSCRFSEKSGIGELAMRVNGGDGEGAFSLFTDGKFSDLGFTEIPQIPAGIDVRKSGAMKRLIAGILTGYAPGCGSPHYHGGFGDITSPEDALNIQSRFQILCAMRKGPFGSVTMNLCVEDVLRAENRISGRGTVYAALPVLVTENDHPLRLYNGDAGMVWETDGVFRAYFSTGGSIRSVLPLQISAWEKGYALTVHKSQGSEYDHVAVILGYGESRALTRELIYTAVTRAKKSVHIIGRKDDFIAACGRATVRESGLADRLR